MTAIYSDMTKTATKSFTELSKNKEIMEMMSIREDDPSGHLMMVLKFTGCWNYFWTALWAIIIFY